MLGVQMIPMIFTLFANFGKQNQMPEQAQYGDGIYQPFLFDKT